MELAARILFDALSFEVLLRFWKICGLVIYTAFFIHTEAPHYLALRTVALAE